jgi:hypothetical protein
MADACVQQPTAAACSGAHAAPSAGDGTAVHLFRNQQRPAGGWVAAGAAAPSSGVKESYFAVHAAPAAGAGAAEGSGSGRSRQAPPTAEAAPAAHRAAAELSSGGGAALGVGAAAAAAVGGAAAAAAGDEDAEGAEGSDCVGGALPPPRPAQSRPILKAAAAGRGGVRPQPQVQGAEGQPRVRRAVSWTDFSGRSLQEVKEFTPRWGGAGLLGGEQAPRAGSTGVAGDRLLKQGSWG